MKIVIDLQCCQTGARLRGMGRYSLALSEAVTRIGREHDFLFLLNRRYLSSSSDLARQIERFGTLANVVAFDYPPVEANPKERLLREQIANVLRNDRVETLGADIYHVSSLFEGESFHGAAPAFVTLPKPPLVRSATLYDVIPALYPEHYLQDDVVRSWYHRTMSLARQLDLALADSEVTRQDSARLLKIDPGRIVNILGSAGEEFRELEGPETRRGAIWRRLDANRPYLLYVGGPDFRKNIDGMLEAFALAGEQLGKTYQLVLVFSETGKAGARPRRLAAQLGIAEQVVITGHVSDEELAELYNHCALFVFPALYEGLGLPAIEAMRCGAPVLVGDNSSLREVVDEPRYRFDASSPPLIAQSIVRSLTLEGETGRMRAYARERARFFSWDRSGRLALDAWEEALDRRRSRASIRMPSAARPRIAMFTPLPPAGSGGADDGAAFLAELRQHADFEVFVENAAEAELPVEGVGIWHHTQFPLRAQDFDAIVYRLGNSPSHRYMAPYMETYPGVVVLHDAHLGHLSHNPRELGAFARQAIRDHGGEARRLLDEAGTLKAGALALAETLTCAPTHVYRSRGVVVHSLLARDLLASSSRPAVAPPIAVVPQAAVPAFIRTVLEMTARSRSCGPAAVIEDLSRLLAPVRPSRELVAGISSAYVAQERSEDGPRLLIDVTNIRESDARTGIQRVVREVTREIYRETCDGLRPQAVAFAKDGLIYADDYAQSCGARLPVERPDARSGPLKPGLFDKMLLLDSSWHLAKRMEKPVAELNALGGQVYGVIQDILPFQHPRFFPDHFAVALRDWLVLVAGQGDGIICSSRTGAESVIELLKSGAVSPRPGLRIGYAWLGADFTVPDRAAQLLPETRRVLEGGTFFLMVATIEPRKGHATALDAFEQLWAQGEDVTLAIVGKQGWMVEELIARLGRHPENGRRLARLGFLPEADLAALYAGARATILASLAEGFGLPIYEAAHHGTSLLLSDLPVFREIAGEHARYFEPGSAASLAEAVRMVLREGPLPSGGLVAPSWGDCARGILDFVAGRGDYYVFGAPER